MLNVSKSQGPLTQFFVGGHICPPTLQIHFSAEPHDRGASKYTQNLSFVIAEHIKLVQGPKKFPIARESLPNVHFLKELQDRGS